MNVMASRTTNRTKSPHENGLLHRILPVIRRRALFSPGDSILVAVSGGPDSVALLSVLHELRPAWNLTLSVIHINYGLRGRESDEDAVFVQRLCDELAVPCITRRGDSVREKVPGGSSLAGTSSGNPVHHHASHGWRIGNQASGVGTFG